MSRAHRRWLTLALMGLLLLVSGAAHATTEPDAVWSDPSAPFEHQGPVRIAEGDDPAFARPDYDDRSWRSLSLPTTETLSSDDGFLWMRTRIDLAPALRAGPGLRWIVQTGGVPFELYCDGERVGERGRLAPLEPTAAETVAFSISDFCRRDGALLLAVRFRFPRVQGLTKMVLAAEGAAPYVQRSLEAESTSTLHIGITLASLLLALFLAGSTYLLRPHAPAFGWMALAFFFLFLWGSIWTSGHPLRLRLAPVCVALAYVTSIEALWRMVRPHRLSFWLRGGQLLIVGFIVALLIPGRTGLEVAAWPARAPIMLAIEVLMSVPIIPDTWRKGGAYRLAALGIVGVATGTVLTMVVFVFRVPSLHPVATGVSFLATLATNGAFLSAYLRQAVDDRDAERDAALRFVPRAFLALLGHEHLRDVERAEAKALDLTVMFVDIRGFTPLSERLGPDATFRFMNAYHATMEPVIAEEGGFINQIYGDGIMAMFPDPVAAMAAAEGMVDALEGFNAEQPEAIAIGFGLHRGDVMLGTIGSEDRLDTGVIGDTVNTAARLQELTKTHGVTLIASAEVVDAIGSSDGYTSLGTVELRGKAEATPIYGWSS